MTGADFSDSIHSYLLTNMKIAMIGQKGMPPTFGGVERHVHDISVRLFALGHTVSVYARNWYTKKDITHVRGVEIIRLPSLHTKHLDTISHVLLSTIHAMFRRVDIIHYHGVGPSLLSWIPRVFTPNIRVINTFHSVDRKHKKWGWFARLVLRTGEWTACTFAHRTIAVSQTISTYAEDVYNRTAHYIPNAVSLPEKGIATSTITPFGLQSQSYVLLVTRLIPHKGVQYAITAWKKLEKEYPQIMAGKQLVVVGKGHYTNTYERRLQKMAESHKSIIFLGFQSGNTLQQLFAHANCFIQPSDNEGMSLALLEAMSHKLPVIASDIIENIRLIKDPRMLFRRSKSAALAKTLLHVLHLSAKEKKEIGMQNYRIVTKDHTPEKVVQQLHDVYTAVFAQPSSRDEVCVPKPRTVA